MGRSLKKWLVTRLSSFRSGQDTKPHFFMKGHPDYSLHHVGEWTYGHPNIPRADEAEPLTIGRFCSIASDVTIFLGNEHHVDWVSTYPFAVLFPDEPNLPFPSRTKGRVVIGHDVWIGTGAMILSGVTIGNGAVIGAGSLITKEVAPYSIVGGVPARHIRYRFDESARKLLQQIAWWNWPLEKIREALPLLMSPDIQMFLGRYGSRGGHLDEPDH